VLVQDLLAEFVVEVKEDHSAIGTQSASSYDARGPPRRQASPRVHHVCGKMLRTGVFAGPGPHDLAQGIRVKAMVDLPHVLSALAVVTDRAATRSEEVKCIVERC
jgi:hypothetical protein